MKTRYAKPFEAVQVKIPYETGMDPHSGLVDLFEKKGLLKQQGNRLKYIDSKGIEHLDYRKQWTGDKLKLIMEEISGINVVEKTTEKDPLEVSKMTKKGE